MSYLDLDVNSFLKSVYKECIISIALRHFECSEAPIRHTWWANEMFDMRMVNKIEIRKMEEGTIDPDDDDGIIRFCIITEKASSAYMGVSSDDTTLKIREYANHHNIEILRHDTDLHSFQNNPDSVMAIDTDVRAWYDSEIAPILQSIIDLQSL